MFLYKLWVDTSHVILQFVFFQFLLFLSFFSV